MDTDWSRAGLWYGSRVLVPMPKKLNTDKPHQNKKRKEKEKTQIPLLFLMRVNRKTTIA
jgi:hypothetical protein